jgi:hypothetical protein
MAEWELLGAILLEDATYPWNLEELAAASYFDCLQQNSLLREDFSDSLTISASKFSEQLQSFWDTLDPASAEPLNQDKNLSGLLIKQFANQIPQDLLVKIAEKALQAFNSTLSPLEQVVRCVQEVLPQWDIEDLLVLDRPLANAMRDREGGITTFLKATQSVEWAKLSDIEKARLCLAVTRFAVSQVEHSAEA